MFVRYAQLSVMRELNPSLGTIDESSTTMWCLLAMNTFGSFQVQYYLL